MRHAHANSARRAAGGADNALCRRGVCAEQSMKTTSDLSLSRREFMARGGALVVAFTLAPSALVAQSPSGPPKLPGSLNGTPMLDAWIRVTADGSITVMTGKA